MKRQLWMVLFVAVACLGMSGIADAQVYHASQAPYGGYGIQATAQPGNGLARHYNNGFVGVNYRHYSPYPMRYGTSAGQGYYGAGPVVSYTRHGYGHGYRRGTYGCANRGYVHGGYGHGGGYVGGAYHGNGFYIQGGVSFR